jgi:integrase
MPTQRLTDVAIRTAKMRAKPYRMNDGAGLYLEIRPSGEKRWRFRYKIAGIENLYTLGAYPEIGLREARERLSMLRGQAAQGIHPIHQRQQQHARQIAENKSTFEAVAREWIEQNQGHWSASYVEQVERVLGQDVLPSIGSLPIRQVSASQILSILQRIQRRGAVGIAIVAKRCCSATFRYAVSTLRADGDPTGALRGALKVPKPAEKVPLSVAEIQAFRRALLHIPAQRTTAIALELLLHLFCRPGELRGAPWSEFEVNGDEPTWRVPAGRMKMGRLHIIPLSAQVVGLLRELHTLTGYQVWLFPNQRRPRDCMQATTLNRALERMGYSGRLTAHGFRATASTHLNEQGFPPDWIERQLAHQEKSAVRRAYNKAEYLSERRKMMQHWSNWLEGIDLRRAEVIPLRRRSG